MARKKKESGGRFRGVRSFWSGSISFGLVTVPVDLYPATRRSGVTFRMLAPDGTPLERRYWCPKHETDVDRDELIRGYPVDGEDEYVLVPDDELDSVEPEKSREIDLQQFVRLSDISPFFFDRPYYLTPSGDTNKPYRLLARVMEEAGRAGIARVVMRNHEYLIAILAENGILCAETLRFASELRTPESVGLPEAQSPEKETVKEMRERIAAALADDIDEEWLTDEYAKEVRRVAERRLKKDDRIVTVEEEAVEREDPEDAREVDLLETIRQSLRGGANGSAGRNGRGGGRGGGRMRELRLKSKSELYEEARAMDIPGRSDMKKDELIDAIRDAEPA